MAGLEVCKLVVTEYIKAPGHWVCWMVEQSPILEVERRKMVVVVVDSSIVDRDKRCQVV